MRWDSTAGSLISTPADIGAWYRALLSGEVLPRQQLRELKRVIPVSPDGTHG